MIFKALRRALFPLLAFTGIVSVGFGAWAFTSDQLIEAAAYGNVEVTGLWEGQPGTFAVNAGATTYTLVFSEDLTNDETVGVNLYPDISYTFSKFVIPEIGNYAISYRVEYTAASIYGRYVDIPSDKLESAGTDSVSQALYMESKPLVISTAEAEEQSDGTYTMSGTFSPVFRWKSGTKPTDRETHNTFISMINATSETFTLTLILEHVN